MNHSSNIILFVRRWLLELAQHRCSVNTWWNELNRGNKQDIYRNKYKSALIDLQRCGCPFLFSSILSHSALVTAVQFIFMLKSLMLHDCSRTDLDSRRNECWNFMSFLNKWWIGSMVKFEMRDLQRANILNNKLLLIYVSFQTIILILKEYKGFELAQ